MDRYYSNTTGRLEFGHLLNKTLPVSYTIQLRIERLSSLMTRIILVSESPSLYPKALELKLLNLDDDRYSFTIFVVFLTKCMMESLNKSQMHFDQVLFVPPSCHVLSSCLKASSIITDFSQHFTGVCHRRRHVSPWRLLMLFLNLQ